MAYNIKTSISFGMVFIPVSLTNAVKNSDISFNMLEKKTLSRVMYKKTCYECQGRELSQQDLVKGYQYEKGKFVLFEDSDFEKIKTKKDKTITIEKFVSLAEIDPIYFDKAYYVLPDKKAEKAYSLLASALLQSGKVGIASTVLGNKEVLVAIRAKADHLLINTMFFDDDVTTHPSYSFDRGVSPQEQQMAQMIIDGMSGSFDPKSYHDEYKQKLLGAIEAKIEGKEIVSADKMETPALVDLMDALKASLEAINQPKTQKKGTQTTKKTTVQKKTAKR